MSNLTDKVQIPNKINPKIEKLRQSEVIKYLGYSRDEYYCHPPGSGSKSYCSKNPKNEYCPPANIREFKQRVVTRNVGPFRVTGFDLAVKSLKKIFKDIKREQPGVYRIIGSRGMLCCRRVSGSKSISNHAWGLALDTKLGKVNDDQGDNKVLYGLTLIAPIFNRHGWYWGAGFSKEDGMHFQVGRKLFRKWAKEAKLIYNDTNLLLATAKRRINPKLLENEGEIAQLQELLNATMGLELQVDGQFGPGTRASLLAFQHDVDHLPVDGILRLRDLQLLRELTLRHLDDSTNISNGDKNAETDFEANYRSRQSISRSNKANTSSITSTEDSSVILSVDDLQEYLRRFGYLERHRQRRGKSNVRNEDVGLAVRLFQQFHGLEITGEFDAPTAVEMSKSRCGAADYPHSHLRARAEARRGWSRKDLVYKFVSYTPDLKKKVQRKAFSKAFQLWEDVCGISFEETQGTADIDIHFSAGDHGDGLPFDGKWGVAAHAFYPPPGGGKLAGDLHFDEAEAWSVKLPLASNKHDLITIAAHEIGHAIGLRHSSVKKALMFPKLQGVKRRLHKDDIRNAQTLYGR